MGAHREAGLRVVFHMRGEKPVEDQIAQAVARGAPQGVTVDVTRMTKYVDPAYDAACVVGVKSLPLVEQLRAAGKPWIYFDKAYNRDWPRWWRVSVCGHQPTDYLAAMECPGDRARAQGWEFSRWREVTPAGPVLFAGASLKYHRFCGLGDPTSYARDVVSGIKAQTRRPVIYRPKPSWSAAEPVEGARFSWQKSKQPEGIARDLRGAHALVTHGSAAVLDAVLAGVPTVVLGHAVTRPISSTSLAEVDDPRLADAGEVRQLLANLAYCQWTVEEFGAGMAWPHILRALEAVWTR